MTEDSPVVNDILRKEVLGLADLVIDRYQEIQHLVYGTVVGMAYHFDGDFICEKPTNNAPYANVIPLIFEGATSLEKPDNLIPKSVSPFGFYNQLFLLNRDYFDDRLIRILKDAKCVNLAEAEDIFTDRRLLRQAAIDYKVVAEQKRILDTIDFIDFLLSYNIQSGSLQQRKGSYQHLLGRLFFRFGENNFEKKLFSHAPCKEIDEAARIHTARSVEHQVLDLNADLSNLATRLSPERSYVPIRETASEGYKIKIPGLHRVRVPGGDGVVDWNRFATERRRLQLSVAAFGPEEVLEARVQNILNQTALNLLNDKKQKYSMEEIKERLTTLVADSSYGKRIIDEVMDTVEIIMSFDGFKGIYHNMPVTIVKKR